jgi:4'-phosphopantetheinyl transferase EntD
MLHALFPSSAAVAALRPDAISRPLEVSPAWLARQRRIERRLGRQCAADALEALGVRIDAADLGEGRLPRWPAGFTGSISHCDTLCCAVAGRAADFTSLGVDVEGLRSLGLGVALVCGPSELACFATLPSLAAGDWPMVAFSAKEAFYKCQYGLTGRLLDFRDFEIGFQVDSPHQGRFQLRRTDRRLAGDSFEAEIHGAWAIDHQHVYTAAWRTSECHEPPISDLFV